MENCYIVRLNVDHLLCFYSKSEAGIFYKTFERGKWSKETVLLERARTNFTITLDKDGVLYMFCQDFSGNIVTITDKSGAFESRIIIQNQSEGVIEVLLSAIIAEKGMRIIYNVPNEIDKSQALTSQTVDELGKWGSPETIDKFYLQNNKLYTIQHISPTHALLFYHTRTPENNIGFLEITEKAQGTLNLFHTTPYAILDSAYLTTQKAVHVLLIVKTMFSSQLIYKVKNDKEFSPPTLIWEAQNLNNCLPFFVDNILYVTYTNNGMLYVCESGDFGATFSRPSRYKNKFCLQPKKATYISHTPQSEQTFYTQEVYVDSTNISDVQILPDLYESFYQAD